LDGQRRTDRFDGQMHDCKEQQAVAKLLFLIGKAAPGAALGLSASPGNTVMAPV
jgi:hypothetical protein